MATHPFEIIDHTADVGLRIRGKDLPQLFCNAALGMFSIICDVSQVRKVERLPVAVQEDELPYLLIEWLQELLYIFSAKHMLFCEFSADVAQGKVSGSATGELLDFSRHSLKAEIKGATYCGLEVKRRGGIWTAEIIFDI